MSGTTKKTSILYKFIEESKDNKIILFGASAFGQKVFKCLSSYGLCIDCFCDNDKNKWNSQYCGLKVISPETLSRQEKTLKIVVSSECFEEINIQLKEMGFVNIFFFSSYFLYEHLGGILQKAIKYGYTKIQYLMELLEDDKSRDVIKHVIDHRLTFDYQKLSDIADNKATEYFPFDIMKFSNDETFVDAGAFDGDSTQKFIKKMEKRFKQIYAFEPDEYNYSRLKENLKTLTGVSIFKAGLYNQNEQLGFHHTGKAGARLAENSTQLVDVVSLDQFFKNEKITFIKMDIEGAEKEALEGAKKLIISYKPKLAICVYHKPDDLWEIPLYIKSLVPEYKLYIRHYSLTSTSTVCYAVL
jgi:FkbM family methyltransferase